MTQRTITASAPQDCDMCAGDLRRYFHYYDARTHTGQWAWMCFACFRRHGRGLGLGVGQEYKSATNVKTRG